MADLINLDDLVTSANAFLESDEVGLVNEKGGLKARQAVRQLQEITPTLQTVLDSLNDGSSEQSEGSKAASKASKSDPTDTAGKSFDRAADAAHNKFKKAVGA